MQGWTYSESNVLTVDFYRDEIDRSIAADARKKREQQAGLRALRELQQKLGVR